MPDFYPDDLFENEFTGDRISDEVYRKIEAVSSAMVQYQPFTDPVALAIVDNGPLSIDYLLRYDDHAKDDFEDLASIRFKKWFLTQEHAPEVSMYYAAVCVEQAENKRPNNSSGTVASDFFREFNRSGYGYFDSKKYGVKTLIEEESYTTRLGRMYNVWYREEFAKADGASLFHTRPIGLKFHNCCKVCGSKVDNYGKHHLEGWLLNASPEDLRLLHHRLRPLLLAEYPINWEEGFRNGQP